MNMDNPEIFSIERTSGTEAANNAVIISTSTEALKLEENCDVYDVKLESSQISSSPTVDEPIKPKEESPSEAPKAADTCTEVKCGEIDTQSAAKGMRTWN